jgi:hypothetical protein
MSSRIAAISLTLASLAAPLSAAEILGGFVDMRLGLGVAGGEYTVEDFDNDTSVDETYDTAYRATLSWIGSLGLQHGGGVVWGLGGSYNDFEDDDSFKFRSWALDGYIGYGIAFTESFQLELVPFMGVGRSYVDVDGDNVEENNDSYTEGGANLNVFYTFHSGFQLGATLTYLLYSSDINYNDVRYNFGSADLVGSLILGVRL